MPMTQLPAGGRTGKTPRWPLGADVVTQAKLRVAQAKVERLLAVVEQIPAAEAQLTRAQERAEVLAQVVEIQRKAEASLWRELWHTPQAVAWERLCWTREVAQYTRWKVLAENGELDAAKEARQLADRLGLTPLAMLRLRWEIAPDEVAEQRAARQPAQRRPRLKAVDPGAVARP